MIITDAQGCILDVNDAFTTITGFPREEVIGRNASVLKSGAQDAAFYEAMWAALAERGTWQGEVVNRRRDGTTYRQGMVIQTIPNIDERQYLGTFTNISERSTAEARLFDHAFFDNITGLPARILLGEQLNRAIERHNGRDARLVVILAAIDRLPMINETLGLQQGDSVLREIARRLSSCVRNTDTVARYGGKTFACVITDAKGNDATPIITRIMGVCAQPIVVADREFHPSASLGIALWPKDGGSSADLLQNAVRALRKAREGEGGSFRYYEPAISAETSDRLLLEADLRRALIHDKKELLLHYQPKFAAATGLLVGAEALVRWAHPKYGMINPGRFIGIAEESGLVLPLGNWVLDTAVAQIRQWISQVGKAMPVAVNLSSHQLHDTTLVQTISDVIAAHGIEPQMIELELTERVMARNIEAACEILTRLRDMGFSIAVDDFGTGYSNFANLHQLPITRLKLDKSFISGLEHTQSMRPIVSGIINLAHSLNMSVTAEGVETACQFQILRDIGCDEVQGYLHGRPMAPSEFDRVLRNGTTSWNAV